MKIGVAGAGAFGTALAVALSANGPVRLWARDREHVSAMSAERANSRRLPGISLPEDMSITDEAESLADCDTVLIAVPAQQIHRWLEEYREFLGGKRLVACCKGIDLETLEGPAAQIAKAVPNATPAMLTGPSFAIDIARHLPTALTLACAEPVEGAYLQSCLSTPTLRLYRSTDVIGAELGGALKNVVAIACGVCMGAGFGESARAALITRGFAEMRRLGASLGADPETLVGLSGFGDLALTCTSDKSRNYQFGLAIGRAEPFNPETTVEGAATAGAARRLARKHGLDLPITDVVHALSSGEIDPEVALTSLLSRPLKEE